MENIFIIINGEIKQSTVSKRPFHQVFLLLVKDIIALTK
jgi:hypothetical protein